MPTGDKSARDPYHQDQGVTHDTEQPNGHHTEQPGVWALLHGVAVTDRAADRLCVSGLHIAEICRYPKPQHTQDRYQPTAVQTGSPPRIRRKKITAPPTDASMPARTATARLFPNGSRLKLVAQFADCASGRSIPGCAAGAEVATLG